MKFCALISGSFNWVERDTIPIHLHNGANTLPFYAYFTHFLRLSFTVFLSNDKKFIFQIKVRYTFVFPSTPCSSLLLAMWIFASSAKCIVAWNKRVIHRLDRIAELDSRDRVALIGIASASRMELWFPNNHSTSITRSRLNICLFPCPKFHEAPLRVAFLPRIKPNPKELYWEWKNCAKGSQCCHIGRKILIPLIFTLLLNSAQKK